MRMPSKEKRERKLRLYFSKCQNLERVVEENVIVDEGQSGKEAF
jgi:predicted fused transcriptional regulator/phosphomethylpyrimidine kinase